jgi:hypothetical protein
VHRTVTIGLVGAVVTAVVAIASASAGTTPTATGHARIDTSSRAAIYKYLRSQGLDPAKVVIQRGARVYAGPHCPGRRWHCTRATRVFQAGTVAKAECTGNPTVTGPSAPPDQSCSFSQAASVNSASCKLSMTTDAPAVTQNCTISQTGDQNTALVLETISQTNGAGGSASQNASVDQTGTTQNKSTITQSITQTATSSIVSSQSQEANQNVTVGQRGATSATAVDNSSTVAQTQSLKESASGTAGATQTQNSADNGPDTEATVTQDSGGGINTSDLAQSETLSASTAAAGASQTQGSRAGGNDGTADQHSLAPGYSTSSAKQSKTYTANAPAGATQTQFDPSICCSVQTGNPDKDTEKIEQKSSLNASNGLDATQTLLMLLNCDSDNTLAGCNGKEAGSVNGVATKNECSTSPCHIGISCSSIESEGACVPAACGVDDISCPPPPCVGEFCEIFLQQPANGALWSEPRPLVARLN